MRRTSPTSLIESTSVSKCMTADAKTSTIAVVQINESTNTDNTLMDTVSVETQTINDTPTAPDMSTVVPQQRTDEKEPLHSIACETATAAITDNSSSRSTSPSRVRVDRPDENYVVSRRLIHSKSPVSAAAHRTANVGIAPLLQLLQHIDTQLPLQHPKQNQIIPIRNNAISADILILNTVTNVQRHDYISA